MRVLFVCTGNSFRSPLAAARFNQLSETPAHVAQNFATSAGLRVAGDPDLTQRGVALAAMGITNDSHLPQPVTSGMIAEADLVICLESWQLEELSQLGAERNSIRLLGEHGVADPAESGDYVAATAQIDALVSSLFEELANLRS